MTRKLLIYSHSFAPQVGGTEVIVESLARGLDDLATEKPGSAFEITVVTRVPSSGTSDDDFPFRVVRNPTLATLLRLIRDCDVMHLGGPALLPIFLGLVMSKFVVVEHHGFQAICPNGQLFYRPAKSTCPGHFMASRHLNCLRCNACEGKFRSLKMLLFEFPRRWLCQRVAANILPTEWLRGLLQLPRSIVIPHGLTPDLFRPAPTTPPPAPSFVFLGRLVGTKGVHVLLDASRKLKDTGFIFKVSVIGTGPERVDLETLTKDLELTNCVDFLGYLSGEKLELILAGASAIVMPSLAGEVFGLVALENMFRGIPLIVSDIGSLREIVGDKGLTFPPGNVDALTSCMRWVLEEPAKARLLGTAARIRAMSLFGRDRMVERHISVYRGEQEQTLSSN